MGAAKARMVTVMTAAAAADVAGGEARARVVADLRATVVVGTEAEATEAAEMAKAAKAMANWADV